MAIHKDNDWPRRMTKLLLVTTFSLFFPWGSVNLSAENIPDEVLELQRSHRRAATGDYSDLGIEFPLKQKWMFQDKGTYVRVRLERWDLIGVRDLAREICVLAADKESVFAGGACGRIYKIRLADGDCLWESKGPSDSEFAGGCLIGNYLIVMVHPSYDARETRKNFAFIVFSTETGKQIRSIPRNIEILDDPEFALTHAADSRNRDSTELSPEYVEIIRQLREIKNKVPSYPKNPIHWDDRFLESLFPLTGMEFDENGSFYRSIMTLKGRLASDMFVLKYRPTGEIVWQLPINGHIAAQGKGDLFVCVWEHPGEHPDSKSIIRLSKENGKELWRCIVMPDSGYGYQIPQVFIVGDNLLVTANDFLRLDKKRAIGGIPELNFIVLNRKDGKEVYFHRFSGISGNRWNVSLGHKVLFIAGQEGKLYCFTKSD